MNYLRLSLLNLFLEVHTTLKCQNVHLFFYELLAGLSVIVNMLTRLTCSCVFLYVTNKVRSWRSNSDICFTGISRM